MKLSEKKNNNWLSSFQGIIYAFGGNVGQTSLSACEKYDPHLDRWTHIASMKHRRAGAAAVVGLIDKYIYVFGKTFSDDLFLEFLSGMEVWNHRAYGEGLESFCLVRKKMELIVSHVLQGVLTTTFH